MKQTIFSIISIAILLLPAVLAHDVTAPTNRQRVEFTTPQTAAEKPYVIYANVDLFKNETIAVHNVKGMEGTITNNYPAELPFYVKVIAADKSVLYYSDIPVGFHRQVSTSEGDYVFDTNVSPQRLRLPFYSKAKYVEFYHADVMFAQINLSDYLCNKNGKCEQFENEQLCPSDCGAPKPAQGGCGNKICDTTETHATCPVDCPSGGRDNYCDRVRDGICDPDCTNNEDPDCAPAIAKTAPKFEIPKWFLLALFALAIIFIALLVMILNKKQPPAQQYPQQFQQYRQ